MSKQYWIYHERQQALLCGQHALNNLVQQNVFSPQSLAEIAHQLDAMELNYMAQNNEGGTKSKDYLKRAAEGSGNVVSSIFLYLHDDVSFECTVLFLSLTNYVYNTYIIQDESGNFSIEVLRSALMNRYNLQLPNIRQEGVGDKIEM